MTQKVYRLRKWYFDFLTPEFDYCFVYLADLFLLGVAFRSLTVHLARRDRRVQLTKTITLKHVDETNGSDTSRTIRFSSGHIKINQGSCSIDVSEPGCSLRLKYTALVHTSTEPVIVRTRGKSQILWKPLHMKSSVTGTVNLDGETTEAVNSYGYVDYLESSYLPPVVPIRTLYWGRLHHPEVDLVYMRAANGSESATWSRLSARIGVSMKEWQHITIENGPGSGGSQTDSTDEPGYKAHTPNDADRIHLTVRHTSTVQDGSFLDHQHVRSRFARSILKTLTRDPRSTKWLSHADVVVEYKGTTRKLEDVPLIDEFALL